VGRGSRVRPRHHTFTCEDHPNEEVCPYVRGHPRPLWRAVSVFVHFFCVPPTLGGAEPRARGGRWPQVRGAGLMGNLMGVSGVLHRLLCRSVLVAKMGMVLRRNWSKKMGMVLRRTWSDYFSTGCGARPYTFLPRARCGTAACAGPLNHP